MDKELLAGAVDAMRDGAIQASPRGALSVLGRGLGFVLSLPIDKVKGLGLDGIVNLLETAFKLAVVNVNFPQIPDFIEDPLEAWALAQIRPLVISLFGGVTGG